MGISSMARDFNAVQKGDTLAAQPIDTTVSAATQMPGLYVYGPPGARRARTYSQVIAEATNGGIDSSANLHNGGRERTAPRSATARSRTGAATIWAR